MSTAGISGGVARADGISPMSRLGICSPQRPELYDWHIVLPLPGSGTFVLLCHGGTRPLELGAMHTSLSMTRSFLVLMALTALAVPGAAQMPPPDGDAVVARLAGAPPVLMSEIDEQWRSQDPVSWVQNAPYLHLARRSALELVVARRVLAADAAAAGLGIETYLEALVDQRVSNPTEQDIAEFARRIAREQPSLPAEFRNDFARLRLGDALRIEERSLIITEAYLSALDLRIFSMLRGCRPRSSGTPAIGPAGGADRMRR